MRKLGLGILTAAVFLLFAGVASGKQYEDFIKVKRYKKNTEWKYEECTYCNGTGFVSKRKYDNKRNRTKVIVTECPYCEGTGKVGMSKK